MDKPNNTEQWLLDGKCTECRRNKYCSKPCTRHKRRINLLVHNMASAKLNEMTGGVYRDIMGRLRR